MHNLEAVVELAKAGMTYEQISDLLTKTSQDEPKPEPKPEPEEPEDKEDEPKPEPKEPEQKDPEPDYKKMYEESQKALQAAQKANRQKEETQSKPKSAEEQLVDIFADAFF